MGLKESVTRAFEANGVLAQHVERFLPRSGQTVMAQAVAGTIENGGLLVVEAGTGVGKTYAYLVPALLSGKRILLSTATKALQDQLFARDIPQLTAVLGVPVRIAMLKGRSSYLCMYRVGLARHDLRAMHPAAQADLAWIERWSNTTTSGDLAELPLLDERSPVMGLVTSTRENCEGTKCPQLHACHVNLARREAMAADIVVINHHLFFADINVRESGVAELLPTVQSVVFDEAHQLNEIGVQFMGRQLTIGQLDRYANDLASFASHRVLAVGNWDEVVAKLKHSISGLNVLCRTGEGFLRQAWFEDQPPGVDAQVWATTLQALHTVLQQVEMALRSVEELLPEGKGLRERSSQLTTELDVFSYPVQQGWVRWIEGGERVKLVQSPLDIADTMRSRVIPVDPAGEGRRSLIFTSATLGHDATLSQFLDSCGLHGADVLQVESPFDYKSQAAIYIPAHLPKPSAVTHSESVADLVAKGAVILGGRTLVLTTTVRAMRDIAEKLRQHFSQHCDIQVLLQGESSKRELTDRFRRGPNHDAKGTILVATASFWEGVDVPGDALQLVVIDKLPFPPPNDPLVAARSRNIEARGKSPFQYLHVAHAAIAMKQGAGRLIRRETDRGILVVCDVRLIQMGYGRRILAALPPMQKINSEDEFIQALSALTKLSTKAH
jgi:ATP-dependent DNA helicase DinG